jgi:hypothetical protein
LRETGMPRLVMRLMTGFDLLGGQRPGLEAPADQNLDTGGEVVFQRICAPMGRMISGIQDPSRSPCELINVAPSGRPDRAA